MNFFRVAQTFQKIEETDSRLDMTDILVDFLKEADEIEAKIFVYLIEGRVAPQFVTSEFNFSEKSIVNAFADFVKVQALDYEVESRRGELGDIGLVAEELRAKLGNSVEEIGLEDVYEKLWEIITQEGSGSVERKSEQVLDTIKRLSPLESKYFTRIVAGKLRLGLNVKTILDALSVMSVGDKSLREKFDIAYGFDPDIGHLVGIILEMLSEKANEKDITMRLEDFKPIPGVPFLPRLVQRVGSLEEGFERLGKGMILQPKYDGLRCQIHKGVDYSDKSFESRVWSKHLSKLSKSAESIDMFGSPDEKACEIKLFSRDLKDITDMFPEIVADVSDIGAKSFIIDSELAGTDRDGEFIEFQETMTRRRKYGVEDKAAQVPVKAYVFDVLSLDGENLSREDLYLRLKKLENLVAGSEEIVYSESIEINDIDQLVAEFEKFVDLGLEGVIIKLPNGPYIPGVRNFDWIKLKKSIESKVVDTVDLVIIGYYLGSGKQAKFGMGALLGGVYDRKSSKFVPTTKIGTGVTEDQWEEISKRLHDIETPNRSKNIVPGDYTEPDVWVNPEVVAVVEADEISRSKVYPAGKGELGFGLALRFPRLKVWDRADKGPEEATSLGELIELYRLK
ncbi:ATP-dependent DNA ligase [Candidatus Dojkabacteria bacterium]|nr:ATP-dependent DNA ligase [Candidatus Dojkabacteria bacterium]